MTDIVLIAAVARGGVIGDGRAIPWHLPADLAYFKRTTMGHPVIMGRATFDSIGFPLPGRRTIVVTRQPGWHHAGVEVAHSVSEALALAGPVGPVFVAGGGQIYAEAMPVAARLLITHVEQDAAGSVTFPPIDERLWRRSWTEPHDGYAFAEYLRRGSAEDRDTVPAPPAGHDD